MKYKSINREFICRFPEFKNSYNNFFMSNEVTEEEFQYILYEGLIAHIVDILLYMKISDKRRLVLERLFSFVESMIFCDEDDIVTLAYIAFFEYRNLDWISKAARFMSPRFIDWLAKEFPFWDKEISDQSLIGVKYTYFDEHKISNDIWNIFKEDGLNIHDIPEIQSVD